MIIFGAYATLNRNHDLITKWVITEWHSKNVIVKGLTCHVKICIHGSYTCKGNFTKCVLYILTSKPICFSKKLNTSEFVLTLTWEISFEVRACYWLGSVARLRKQNNSWFWLLLKAFVCILWDLIWPNDFESECHQYIRAKCTFQLRG